MTIHIIINEHNEEVAAYTDKQQASLIAEELEEAGLQHYRVEELVCETPPESNKG
jgi:transcription termination factor Rho